MEQMYAGWTNRETWAAGLYIGNDEILYNNVLELLKEENTLYKKVDALKEYIEEYCEEAIETCNRDALMVCQDIGSLWRVNWKELVESYSEEL